MTTISKGLVGAQYAPNVETTMYTAPPGTRTIIDKCTATNVTGSSATMTWKIVPSGGSAATTNVITYQKTVAAGVTEVFPEMVGQVLNAADFVSALAGTASALVIRLSGREMS